ncbi:MAG: hypothetical protein ABIR27_00025, partial [Dokdonella sp.]
MRKICFLAAAIVAALPVAQSVRAASIVVPSGIEVPSSFRQIADYGSWRLFEGDAADLPTKSWVLGDAHRLKFDRLLINTRLPVIEAPAGFSLKSPNAAALQIVQFVGPIKDAWLDQLRAAGAVPIQYVDSDGYLVWADVATRSKLDAMVASGQVLQYSKSLPGFIKLGNSLFDRLQRGAPGTEKASVIVQRYRHDGAGGRERFSALGLKPIDDWTPQLGYEIARFEASDAQIRQLIEFPDVFWVGEYVAPRMNDEMQAQILHGNLNADQSTPLEPGYLPWLRSLGFSEEADAYPILDI